MDTISHQRWLCFTVCVCVFGEDCCHMEKTTQTEEGRERGGRREDGEREGDPAQRRGRSRARKIKVIDTDSNFEISLN